MEPTPINKNPQEQSAVSETPENHENLIFPNDTKPEGYWDRHTSMNQKAISKWFMSGDE